MNLPPAGPSGCRALGVLPPQRRIGEDGDGGGRLFLRRVEEPPRHGRQVQAEIVQGETGEGLNRVKCRIKGPFPSFPAFHATFFWRPLPL